MFEATGRHRLAAMANNSLMANFSCSEHGTRSDLVAHVCWLELQGVFTFSFRADDAVTGAIHHGLQRPFLSLLAAAAMGSLACLGLIKNDKEEGKPELKLDTAGVDTVVLTAVITFIAIMVAHHPEWVS
jgi:hypothetical protein